MFAEKYFQELWSRLKFSAKNNWKMEISFIHDSEVDLKWEKIWIWVLNLQLCMYVSFSKLFPFPKSWFPVPFQNKCLILSSFLCKWKWHIKPVYDIECLKYIAYTLIGPSMYMLGNLLCVSTHAKLELRKTVKFLGSYWAMIMNGDSETKNRVCVFMAHDNQWWYSITKRTPTF